MGITIYKLDASPPARAVMMTAEALKIPDVEYIDVNLFEKAHFTDEYVKMNPQHTVPVLKDIDFAIWDSHAIAAYLVTVYGKDDTLYPKDPKKRAIVDQRLHFDSGILFPVARGCMFPVLFLNEPKFRQENLAKVEPAYEFCEKFLDKTWIAGDQLTIADICCVASISSLVHIVPIDQKKFPKLKAWLERCSKQEFYQKANVPGEEGFRGLVKKEFF